MAPAPPVNKSARPPLSPAALEHVMAVAAARRPADLVIQGVDLFNVHGPAIERGVSLAVARDRIAAVGPDLTDLIGPGTRIIPGEGRFLMPGMIDAHTHLDGIFGVRAFARQALLSGNTTAVSETAMIAGAAGLAGVHGFMAEAAGIPLRVFFLAPPLVPPFPDLETSAGLTLTDFRSLLKRPDVLGVGETYWRPALDLPAGIMARFAVARALGKTQEGHAAGARSWNLNAYRAGGITSCHESTNSEEALERLRLGLAVQIREGYVRSELPSMGPLAARKDLDFRRLILCTDLATPEMLLRTGVMNELVRRAVAVGFEFLQALCMVTLNPADYFGLRDLGRLDPGCLADLVLMDDPVRLNADLVLVGGQVVAERGRLTVDIPDFTYPPELFRTIKPNRIKPADLALTGPTGPVKVRAVGVLNETITREEVVETVAVRGRIAADPTRDLAKIAVFDRRAAPPRASVGLARGLGLEKGAVATSLIWDTNNILVAGTSDREMTLAVNRLLEIGGGLIVVAGRRVLAEMPMPVAGVISEKPFPEIAAQIEAIDRAVRALGSKLTRPFLTLQTFCFTGLPFLRLTDKGLVDVRKGELVPVVY